MDNSLQNNGLVSVIVPARNVEKYISTCLQSIINSTYRNIEIIVVVNNSTDRTLSIVEHYSNIDKRILVLNTNEPGPGNARNIGLDYSKGEYIVFVDADDYITTNYIEYYLKHMLSEKISIVVGYYVKRDNQTALPIIADENGRFNIVTRDYYFNTILAMGKTINVVSKMYRKSTTDNVRFLNIFHEDGDFLNQLYPMINDVVVIDFRGYYYIQNSSSITHNYTINNHIDIYYTIARDFFISLKYQRLEKLISTSKKIFKYTTLLYDVCKIDKYENFNKTIEVLRNCHDNYYFLFIEAKIDMTLFEDLIGSEKQRKKRFRSKWTIRTKRRIKYLLKKLLGKNLEIID